jgi:hypothetical protein
MTVIPRFDGLAVSLATGFCPGSVATGVDGNLRSEAAQQAGAVYAIDIEDALPRPWADQGCALAGVNGTSPAHDHFTPSLDPRSSHLMRLMQTLVLTAATFLMATTAAVPRLAAQPVPDFIAIEWSQSAFENVPCTGYTLSLQVFAEGMTGGTVDIPNHGLETLDLFDEDEGEWGKFLECQLATLPLGQFHIVMNGPGGTDELFFTTTLPLPASGPPTVTSPAPGASDVSVDPTFTWNPFTVTSCATGYGCGVNVELSNDLLDEDIESDFPDISDVSWSPSRSLLPNSGHKLDIEVFDNDFINELTLMGNWVLVKKHAEYENHISFTTGCTTEPWVWYPEEPEGLWTGENAAAFDSFGSDVTVSGDVVAVGADDDDDDTGGYVRVFRRTGFDWQIDDVLGFDVRQPGDIFGSAVAIDGDTLAIGAGAYDHDGSPGVQGSDDRGSVFVYVHVGGAWSLQQELRAAAPADGDEFGASVCLSGDTLVIGATETDHGGAMSAGSAYLFTRSGSAWTEVLRFDSPNPVTDGQFGEGVATTGDWIAVGAPGEGGAISGAAYVRDFDGASLGTAGADLLGEAGGDEFGETVALDLGRLVIGAPAHDGAAANTGAAYVHTYAGPGSWPLEQKLEASDAALGDAFGADVALCADTLVVGASGRADSGFADAGGAYVFDRDPLVSPLPAGPWIEAAIVTAFDPQDADFGESVAVSGHTLVAGAAEAWDDGDPGVGLAWAFRLFKGTWVDQGCALAGAAGAPLLTGDGPLSAGSSNSVALSGAATSALAGLFVGLEGGSAAFKGGTLKPIPPLIAGQLATTNPGGEISLTLVVPPGIPACTEIWIQWAIQDAGAIKNVALSNALMGVTP